MKAKFEVGNETHEWESLPVRHGGNGIIGVFVTGGLSPVSDFALKTNTKQTVYCSSVALQTFIKENLQRYKMCGWCTPNPVDRETVKSSLSKTTIKGKRYVTCYIDQKMCVLHKIDDKAVGTDLEFIRDWLSTAKEIETITNIGLFDKLCRDLEQKGKLAPVLVVNQKWRSVDVISLDIVGPLYDFPEELMILKIKNRSCNMISLNGPGILPNALFKVAGTQWLQMPRGDCFPDDVHSLNLTELQLFKICERIALANRTLLEMAPERLYGDNKPANICFWKNEAYLIDIDEVPTPAELDEGGGPRFYATFQLGGPEFEVNPYLMVLYSYIATVGALSSLRNMSWVYTRTCHTHNNLPKTVTELVSVLKCPRELQRHLETAAQIATDGVDRYTLIDFFRGIEAGPGPSRKKRRYTTED